MKSYFFLTMIVCLLLLAGSAQAAYPERTITMIVPFSAGGGADIVARALVPSLEKELGGKVIVKNVGGAGGTLGATEVSRAEPDGYTIGYLTIGPVAVQPQTRELPYTAESLKPVALVNDTPFVFMVKNDSPMNTLADAKKFLLEKDGEAAYGSPGNGSLTHIATLALIDAMGARAKHIPDRGAAEGMKSLSGNFIQFFADTVSHLKTYDVKALGIYAVERSLDYPDVPTMKEQGYDFEFSAWGGIFVPQNTPEEDIKKLEKAVRSAVNSPEFKNIAQKNSITVKDMGSADFSAFIAKQLVTNKEFITKFGMQQ